MTENNPQVIEEAFLDDGLMPADTSVAIPDKIFFRIGEVSRYLGVSSSVVRYWETEFGTVKPVRSRSGQRLYRRKDLEKLALIKELLYEHRFTIEGAKMQISKMRRGVPAEGALDLLKVHRLITGLKEIKQILAK